MQGYQLRALLVHETFKKVLYLAPGARAEFSSGRVFNLVTSDAETLQARDGETLNPKMPPRSWKPPWPAAQGTPAVCRAL